MQVDVQQADQAAAVVGAWVRGWVYILGWVCSIGWRLPVQIVAVGACVCGRVGVCVCGRVG